MKLATLDTAQGPRAAVARDGSWIDIQQADGSLPADMTALLELGTAGLGRVSGLLARAGLAALPAASAELLAPIPRPPKVICIGLNYRDHAIESKAAIPEEPVLFCKFRTAITGPNQPIVLPRVSSEVDYEAELVVVIGKRGRHIPEAQAIDHVAGYMPGHDVSARDWQLKKPGGQWLSGKSFDTFAPIGPALVTRDEVADPHALGIRLRLNGATMQDSNTRELIFRIEKLISYTSQVWTLEPGDLIFTGTPPGVGFARKPPIFLKPGDVAEVEIDGVGLLRNPVVAG